MEAAVSSCDCLFVEGGQRVMGEEVVDEGGGGWRRLEECGGGWRRVEEVEGGGRMRAGGRHWRLLSVAFTHAGIMMMESAARA